MHSLCILSLQIADKETHRKEEMAKTLDYICRRLTQLNVVDNVPDNIPSRNELVNRALDVRSSSMLYLATQLQHDAFGITGLTLLRFPC